MTVPDWNEISQSEEPAARLLESLGWKYVAAEDLEAERGSLKEAVLAGRLEAALKKLNPWISDGNVKKAVRDLTLFTAASVMEANEKVYNAVAFGMTVEQDLGQGKKGQPVKVIDYENLGNNEFIFTRQHRVSGSKVQIAPDLVLFVNGLPLVVLECKSPKLYNPMDQGIEQLVRYQELTEGFKGQGAPLFFQYAQIVGAIAGSGGAQYATYGTRPHRFSEWKIAWPATMEEIQKKIGRLPTPQDVLIFGMLNPENLLDLVRNFIVFDTEGQGKVKKLARYQQFIAVNKALGRILDQDRRMARKNRGGVVWHTQGSGKSLTMLWLALKLRRASALENPTLVIVTDRTDLDQQIHETFMQCGFPNPARAESIQELRKLLKAGAGQTVMTTVQKFMDLEAERRKKDLHPVLSEADNIFVLVDEAHRTQYKRLAANMRRALPNACFLGFTGTPIDKRDKSTRRIFGDYIDTYTIEQAIADKATVPIYYESRLPDVHVMGQNLDELFERYFAEYSVKEREAIKRKYATEEAIGMAPQRIRAICLDLVKHFEERILPNRFKAQIVTSSRKAAVRYKEELEKLAPDLPGVVVITTAHNDEADLAKYGRSKEEEKKLIDCFKDEPAEKLAFLVVCDKLITGFDAPIEQVMYLDKPLREHALLQAIARVNRPLEEKQYGLVVDYWGVSRDLQDALSVFRPEDIIAEQALPNIMSELPRLEARNRRVMAFFNKVNRADLEACIRVLEPEDVRVEFDLAFRRFTQSLDMILPDPAGLKYLADLKWLGVIRMKARDRFRDEGMNLAGCQAKVQKLIDEYIRAEKIDVLLEPVSIFSKKFEEEVAKLAGPDAKASEMEHAIRHEIHVHYEENPVLYESLKERLEKIIQERKEDRVSAVEQLKLLEGMVNEIRNVHQAAESLGLSENGFAVYKLLDDALSKDKGDGAQSGDKNHRNLAKQIVGKLEEHAVIDWIVKDDVQREMRKEVKALLRGAEVSGEEIEPLTARLMDLARARLVK